MNKLFSSSFSQVIFFELIFRLFGFFTSVYVARIISVDGVGMLGIANAIIAYGTLLSSPGFHIFGIREHSKDESLNQEIFYKITALRFIFSFIFSFLLFVSIIFFKIEEPLNTICLISAATIIPFTMQFEWFFQVKNKIKIINYGKIIFVLSQFLSIIFFVKFKSDIIIVSLILFLSNVILFIYQVIFIPEQIVKSNSSNYKFSKIIFSSLPIGFSSTLLTILQNLPFLILGIFATFHETGIYSTAYRIILTLLVVDRFLFLVVFPSVSKSFSEKNELIFEKLQSIMNLIFVYFVIIFLIILIFGKTIIQLIWGVEFIDTYNTLLILTIFLLSTIYNSLLSGILVSHKLEKYYSKVVLIYSMITTILVYYFINYFNSIGAAIAISFGETIMTLLFIKKINSFSKLKFISNLNFKKDFKSLLNNF